QPAAAPPSRHLLGGAGGAQHAGGAEFDQNRPLGMVEPSAGHPYLAQLVGAAPIGSGHAESLVAVARPLVPCRPTARPEDPAGGGPEAGPGGGPRPCSLGNPAGPP